MNKALLGKLLQNQIDMYQKEMGNKLTWSKMINNDLKSIDETLSLGSANIRTLAGDREFWRVGIVRRSSAVSTRDDSAVQQAVVPYQRLFKKLEAHGITGKILKWVKHWLSNRRQKVSINNENSNWLDVTSGVPQGSVLGPVLFIIYINDLDCDLVSKVGKFADYTKLCKSIIDPNDIELLRNDLQKLDKWSSDWQMQFNVDKCTVMHFGHKNQQNEYSLGNNSLKISASERDLGIIIDSSGKFSEQCNAAVKNANTTLGMIRRSITCKSKDIIVRLYKALVRPKLEYCVQVWRPYLRRDIDNLEKVQHRATKMITECRGLNYERRLSMTGLTTLEDRRIRGDMIETFKILNGIDKVNYTTFLI